jgi:predicted metalloprotease
MRLDDAPESENVEDSRGMGRPLAIGGGAVGILVAILGLVFGVDLKKLGLGGGGAQQVAQQGDDQGKGPPKDGYLEFSRKILGMTDEVWAEEFKKDGYGAYRKPHMKLFSHQVHTGCGDAPSSVGPFYCPADEHVYLDPTFFEELEGLGGSKAQFSQAYVIGHEVGHHVQNLLGYSHRADSKRGTKQEHEYSIRLELQADYLAGVWAKHADKKYHILEPGDVDTAIQTARSIGDNRLQKRARGWVSPEGFTHGTDAQRVAAFKDGFNTGDSSKRKLDLYFDQTQTPFDHRTGELQNRELFGR